MDLRIDGNLEFLGLTQDESKLHQAERDLYKQLKQRLLTRLKFFFDGDQQCRVRMH